MIKSIVGAGLLALSTCTTSPVHAQDLTNCNTVEHAENLLTERYQEQLNWLGIAIGGVNIFQLWTNPETGTWTILVINADGLACLAVDGVMFDFVEVQPLGEDM